MKTCHSLYVEAFLYPTEDPAAVRRALGLVMPGGAEPGRQEIESYYGPGIVKLSYETGKAAEIRDVVDALKAGLSADDRRQLAATLAHRVDERGKLFLRLNKQAASQGKFVLDYKGDVVKVVILLAVYPFSRKAALKAAGDLLA